MDIQLNGEQAAVADNLTPAELIKLLGLQDKRVAMEVNQEIVPRSQYAAYRIAAHDRVEILHAIGGG